MSRSPGKLTATAIAAYAELKRSLQSSAILDLRGTPTRVQRGGRVYWYDSYRIGTDVRKTYLGEDSDALRARLLHARALSQAEDERRADRMRLVRLLRAEGLSSPAAGTGSLLSALSAAGAFRHGLTVVAESAVPLYEGELGVRLDNAGVAPDRLTLALPAEPSSALLKTLDGFAFDPVPAVRKARSWRWRQGRRETHVGFFVPADPGTVAPQYIETLGVYAEPVARLDWLTRDPIAVALPWRGGAIVTAPQPERLALHMGDAALLAAVDPDRLAQARADAPALSR